MVPSSFPATFFKHLFTTLKQFSSHLFWQVPKSFFDIFCLDHLFWHVPFFVHNFWRFSKSVEASAL